MGSSGNGLTIHVWVIPRRKDTALSFSIPDASMKVDLGDVSRSAPLARKDHTRETRHWRYSPRNAQHGIAALGVVPHKLCCPNQHQEIPGIVCRPKCGEVAEGIYLRLDHTCVEPANIFFKGMTSIKGRQQDMFIQPLQNQKRGPKEWPTKARTR